MILGRMALLITLFLVLVNIFNNVTTNSPKAETLTAIEIWMLACILFVFGIFNIHPSNLLVIDHFYRFIDCVCSDSESKVDKQVKK